MPTTLPGFLVFAGLLMFLFGVLGSPFRYKDISLSQLTKGQRRMLQMLGIAFMIAGAAIYATLAWTHSELERFKFVR